MIDPTGRLHHPALAEGAVSAGPRSQASQSQAFAAELSDKLGETNKPTAPNSGLPVKLPAGEQPVTWRNSGGSNSTSASTQPSGLSGLVITYPSATPAAGASSPQPASFDSTYWASQPAAVQKLQQIQDPTQRTEVAEQLAQQGYSIDVPIMVWGWDPAVTTAARESMGYTWVPSALQQPVESAPGLISSGQTPYNPAQPPAGSITV
jgi:hypothetical protein